MMNRESKMGYATIVAEAEAAVGSVKDPELRRVAFEKILTTLLEGTTARRDVSALQKRSRPSSTAELKKAGTSKKSKNGPKAQVESLVDEGWFKKQRTIAEVKAELANRGFHIAITSLSGPLQSLTKERRLRRQKAAANERGTKVTFAYSNW